MSALGQKRTSTPQVGMSALPPKADIRSFGRDVRQVQKVTWAHPGPSDSQVWRKLRSAPVLADRPSMFGEMAFRKTRGFLLQRCRHCLIPAIVKTRESNHGNNLDDLLFEPVLLKFDEHLVSHRVRDSAGRHRQVECCAFGRREQGASLVAPNAIKLLFVDPLPVCALRCAPCSIGSQQNGSQRARSGA